jgi:acetyltransferase-like isoleucine patch superfamily enzyme
MNPFNPGYFNEIDLKDAGFKSLGKNVQIAKNCTIVGLENISIGDNVRIDSYCSIVAAGQGWLTIGSFVHIAGYVLLSAGGGIEIEDFCGVSHGSKIYSRNDDYTGKFLTGPTVPTKYIGLTSGVVTLKKHVVIGSGSVVLPRVTVGIGSSVGAQSLVNKSLDPWGIYVGCPAKFFKERSQNLSVLEAQLRAELAQSLA